MTFFGKTIIGKKANVLTTSNVIQKLFCTKKKKDVATTTANIITKLHETENMLIKKQAYLESKIEEELETARKNATKNRRVALQALKRKKRLVKELKEIDGTLSTVELQREALESAITNTAILNTMKNASDVLRSAQQNIDLDKLNDIMDDVTEQQNLAREISDVISSPITLGADLEYEDLLRELDEMEEKNYDKEFIDIPKPNITLPEIAADKLPEQAENSSATVGTEDDPDMKMLITWATT